MSEGASWKSLAPEVEAALGALLKRPSDGLRIQSTFCGGQAGIDRLISSSGALPPIT
jgi:hypothetical protein